MYKVNSAPRTEATTRMIILQGKFLPKQTFYCEYVLSVVVDMAHIKPKDTKKQQKWKKDNTTTKAKA